MTRLVSCCALLASQLLASQAFATQSYPLTGRLRVTQAVRDNCGFGAERWPDGLIAPIDRGLRSALSRAVEHMFRAAADDQAADVEVVIDGACAEIVRDASGDEVEIQARAHIIARGAELDRLQLISDEFLFPGVGRDGIARAADLAVEEVAADLAPAFANSVPIVDWLIARGIQPVGSTAVWPPRGESSLFADVAAGVLAGGGEESTVSVLAHFGVARGWLLLQGVAGAWSPPFMAAPSDSGTADIRLPANLRTFDLGLEAGPILRFGPALELRGGGGAHLLFGGADVSPRPGSSSFTHVSPAIFVALQTSRFPSPTGRRLRFGIEVRKYFQTTVGLPELSRTIPAAGVAIAAYLGLEWPLSGGKP